MNGHHPTYLIDEPSLQLQPTLAAALGLNEAIVIQQIHYWLMNEKVGKWIDGRKWVYNTYEEWQGNFPWWCIRTIRRTLDRLRESKILLSRPLNDNPWDQTLWYTIDYDTVQSAIATYQAKKAEKPHGEPCGQNDQMDKDILSTSIWTNRTNDLTKTTQETTTEGAAAEAGHFPEPLKAPKQRRGRQMPPSLHLKGSDGSGSGNDVSYVDPAKPAAKKEKSRLHLRLLTAVPGVRMAKKYEEILARPVITGIAGKCPSPDDAYANSPYFFDWIEHVILPYFATLNEKGPDGMRHLVNLITAMYERGANNYLDYRARRVADEKVQQNVATVNSLADVKGVAPTQPADMPDFDSMTQEQYLAWLDKMAKGT
jgi:hypothetical protein